MQKVAVQLFGDTQSHAKGDRFGKVTMYDLRHSGAVHFRLLAKENPSEISLDAVRHRGGWVNTKMLDYYTQFLGLDGRIEKGGMLLRREKHKLEKEVEALRTEKDDGEKRLAVLEEQLALLKGQLEEVTSFLQKSRVTMEGVAHQLRAPYHGRQYSVPKMKFS